MHLERRGVRIRVNYFSRCGQLLVLFFVSEHSRGRTVGMSFPRPSGGLRCKFDVEWKLIECEQFEVIPGLGSEGSLPELGHSGLAAAE